MRSEAHTSRIKEKLRRLPQGPGVYLMKDRLGTVLYVGKAKNLRNRVRSYFQPSRKDAVAQPKVLAMLDLIHDFETIDVRSEAEALLLEGRLIKEYRPKYNTDFTDNKQFLLVRVDDTETLPRFRTTRNRREDNARYFGPFAHSGLLRQTLAEARKRFGVLLHDAKPTRLPDGRWQLYDDVRAEIFAAEEPVTEAEYRERVDQACDFLAGKTREWIAQMKEEMTAAAKAMEFERAAGLRDRISALERTLRPARRFTGRGDPIRFLQDASEARQQALTELQEAL
ncbi:MAG: GIY-YIG nuclease family protein, partial [Opitutales bacterium]